MRRLINILFYVIIILIVTGCKAEKEFEFKAKDKAPESAHKLIESIDKILMDINSIERINLKIPLKEDESMNKTQDNTFQKNDKEEKEESNEDKNNNESQAKEKEGGEGSEEDKREKQIETLWISIEKSLEGTHSLWNSLEIQALKKGITKETTDKFEKALNKMTKSIENKSIIEVYDYGSQSILFLKPVFDLYIDEIGGDMAVLRYSAYQAYIRAINNNFIEASKVLENREENLNKIRLKIGKDEDKEKVEKISQSLIGFKNSLSENSKILFIIKKDLLIKNISEIE